LIYSLYVAVTGVSGLVGEDCMSCKRRGVWMVGGFEGLMFF